MIPDMVEPPVQAIIIIAVLLMMLIGAIRKARLPKRTVVVETSDISKPRNPK